MLFNLKKYHKFKKKYFNIYLYIDIDIMSYKKL